MEGREIAQKAVEALRPHFMFNVLNQVKYYISKNPSWAEEMVYDLANFYRGCLAVASMEEETLLEEELRAFKSYLKLEKGMNKNMELEWNLSLEHKVKHLIVTPGVLLQMAANLVKEEVRGCKDQRTVLLLDGFEGEQYFIQVVVKETGVTKVTVV